MDDLKENVKENGHNISQLLHLFSPSSSASTSFKKWTTEEELHEGCEKIKNDQVFRKELVSRIMYLMVQIFFVIAPLTKDHQQS